MRKLKIFKNGFYFVFAASLLISTAASEAAEKCQTMDMKVVYNITYSSGGPYTYSLESVSPVLEAVSPSGSKKSLWKRIELEVTYPDTRGIAEQLVRFYKENTTIALDLDLNDSHYTSCNQIYGFRIRNQISPVPILSTDMITKIESR